MKRAPTDPAVVARRFARKRTRAVLDPASMRTCGACGHTARLDSFPVNNQQFSRVYYRKLCANCYRAYIGGRPARPVVEASPAVDFNGLMAALRPERKS